MIYRRTIAIEFNHCDPAGIVFYPRYFEMTNSVVENFFAEVLGYSYARITMEEHCGVPTARIEANFLRPSRLGDRLIFALEIKRIGRASVNFLISGRMEDELRLTADLTLVWVTPDGRAAPWPEGIRARMTTFAEGTPA